MDSGAVPGSLRELVCAIPWTAGIVGLVASIRIRFVRSCAHKERMIVESCGKFRKGLCFLLCFQVGGELIPPPLTVTDSLMTDGGRG